MRIAIYHNLHSGGAKRALTAISQRLAERHSLDLYELSCSDREFCDAGKVAKETFLYRFDPLPILRKPLGRLNYLARLVDLYRLDRLQRKIAVDIDRRDYDVVYVHPCQFTQSPGVLQHLQTPSLYHCQEPLRSAYEPTIPRPYQKRNALKSTLDRLDPWSIMLRNKRAQTDRKSLGASSMIVANSYFSRESIYRIYGVNAQVCYLGIDNSLFRPLGIPRDNYVFTAGALTPNKGFDFIVRGLARIPREIRPGLIVCSNYQEPMELAFLMDLARSSGVDLQLMSMVSDDALVHFYNQAAMVVYAPVLEPFGLVPLEAMACGTPVVAVAEGGVRESVRHAETGLLVSRDPVQLGNAVRYLVANPDLAASYGRNGVDRVKQDWTWDKCAAQMEGYLNACSDGASKAAYI